MRFYWASKLLVVADWLSVLFYIQLLLRNTTLNQSENYRKGLRCNERRSNLQQSFSRLYLSQKEMNPILKDLLKF